MLILSLHETENIAISLHNLNIEPAVNHSHHFQKLFANYIGWSELKSVSSEGNNSTPAYCFL